MSPRESSPLSASPGENHLLAFDGAFPEPWDCLVGVDEAGRGALAGPVIAAAVLARKTFYEKIDSHPLLPFIGDSKQLPPEQRERAMEGIKELAAEGDIFFSCGEGSIEEIATVNIVGATRLAMSRALAEVLIQADVSKDAFFSTGEESLFQPERTASTRVCVLIDGLPLRNFHYPHAAFVKGDGRSLIIAMASIVAKVERDRMMRALAEKYPDFGFARHKGYGTTAHRQALGRHGPCAIHRLSFLKKFFTTEKKGERME